MAEFRWKRAEGDFAVRVDLETIRGVFQKGVVVEPGCKALIIVDGALAETLQAGEYTEGGIAARLRNFDLTRSATAIIVDAGDVELTFDLPGLMTRDPMQIDVRADLVIQVDDPILFYTNVMKGRTALSRQELERRFGLEIQNSLQETIGQRTVEELNTDLSLKRQFELAVGQHLERTFARAGFGFVQFRTIDYRYRGFDGVRGIREDFYLQVTRDEAQLAGRKRLFDVHDRNELQAIFEDTRKLERQVVAQRERARLARELNPLTIDEQKSVEQMEQFLLEMEKGRALRAEELDEFKRVLREKREDAESARVFLLKRVDLQRELEYERVRLLGRSELELELLEAQGRLRQGQLDMELKEDDERRAHVRTQTLRDHQGALERELATTRTELEKRRIVAEIQRIGIEIKKLYDETKLATRVKRQLELGMAKLKVREEKIRLSLAHRREGMRIEEDAKDRRAERRVRIIREMAGASVEALIAVSGEEQGRMLADLKRLEVAKGLSEEQLLALAAEKNPALVTAFEKKFEGLGKEELELMYDRWMKDKDRAKDEMSRTMQEMFNKALDTQRDVSVAAAGASRPTVVTSGGVGGTTVVGGVGAGTFRCTYCGAELVPGAKGCHMCLRPVAGTAPAGPGGGG